MDCVFIIAQPPLERQRQLGDDGLAARGALLRGWPAENMNDLRRICVFAGSNAGARPVYEQVARALGTELAARGIGVVYGGAKVGLMGAVADAALAGGVEVIGIIPDALRTKEVAHDGLTELRVVPSMHERKAQMCALSDGFIALPGGLGTFEELLEMTTWAQLGIHRVPCGLLDVDGYYEPLVGFLDHAVQEGFVKPPHRRLLLAHTDAGSLLDAMAAYEPPRSAVWLDRERS